MQLSRRVRGAISTLLTTVLIAATLGWTPSAQAAPVPTAPNAVDSVPRPDHVVMLILENHSSTNILGNPDAPYINSLAASGANMTSSFAMTHPSQPNYIALFSGALNGVTDNNCPYSLTADNLGSELIAAGRTFAGYSETLPNVGYTGCTSGPYARKHNPWVNFSNVPTSANRPLAGFPTDYATLPDVSIVVPNLNNDMHDGTIAQGDSWVQDHLDGYVQWAKTHNSVFVLTFDEDDNNLGNQIPTILTGERILPGSYSEHIDHYSILRTLQDAFGLPPLANSATASPLLDIWSGAPEALQVLATDTFARTVTAGLGTADVGGPWAAAGTLANYSVSGGTASFVQQRVGTGLTAALPAVSSTDTDLRMTIATNPLPTANGLYLTVVGRRVATNLEYEAVARIRSDGTVAIRLAALQGSSVAVVLKNEIVAAGVTLAAGSPLQTRFQVTGTNPTTLRAKVWTSPTEPTAWQLTATDSVTGLQAAGSIGLTTYLSGGGTVAPVTAKVSALSAQATTVAPVNQPPVAAFTSANQDLVATFDGTGSSDPDGTVTGFSWDFGDASQADSGPTPTHSYAGAGQYPVRLTVTDASGATGSVTHDVTVSALSTTVHASDDFTRTLASGWGSASIGGSWTSPSSASNFSVATGTGVMLIRTAGSGPSIFLDTVASDDLDLQFTAAPDKAATGGGIYLSAVGRRVLGVGEYRAKVHLLAGGAVRVALTFVSATNVETAMVAETPITGLTVAPGDAVQVRLQVLGTPTATVRAQVWKSSGAEPVSWAVTRTDTRVGMQAAGGIGLSIYASSTSTNAPLTVRFAQVRAVTASTLP